MVALIAVLIVCGCSVNRMKPLISVDSNTSEYQGRYYRQGKIIGMYRFGKEQELDGVNGKDEDIYYVVNNKADVDVGKWFEVKVEDTTVDIYDEYGKPMFASSYSHNNGLECESEGFARIFIVVNAWGCRAITMHLDKDNNLLIDDYEEGSGVMVFFSASNRMNRHYLFRRLE